jgi:hypothetical protein
MSKAFGILLLENTTPFLYKSVVLKRVSTLALWFQG